MTGWVCTKSQAALFKLLECTSEPAKVSEAYERLEWSEKAAWRKGPREDSVTRRGMSLRLTSRGNKHAARKNSYAPASRQSQIEMESSGLETSALPLFGSQLCDLRKAA